MDPEGGRKTILLADDDETVREFTAACLRNAGFGVIQAESGEAALAIYKARSGDIDLVLTDMVMPGLFGDQLAVRLWELNSKLRIIFISGNTPQALEADLHLEPGKNFLQKPFTVPELIEIVKERLALAT